MHKVNTYSIKLLFLLFCYSPITMAQDTIDITAAWINEAPPTASVLAGYANITNNTDQAIRLKSVTSKLFSHIEIHRSVLTDDIASMEKQEELLIPAQSTIELAPNSYHLMLFNPKKPLHANDKINLHFHFTNGIRVDIDMTVKRYNHSKSENHHHHH